MTYQTNNPVGSVDVRDLYDNAQNLDEFSNGTEDYAPDRLGVPRLTMQGIRNASQYVNLGPYAAGLHFTSRNQVFSYLGEFYAPGPSIVLPYTTTGVGAGEIANFRSVGDAVLRADLADDADSLRGAALVGYRGRTVREKLLEIVTPGDFGAVGDGVTDDGSALNLAIDYMRQQIDIAVGAITVVSLDLGGKTYATTISINATGLREGWEIRNGTIYGKCTGKAVLDMIGSRSGRLTTLTVKGDSANRPTVGIQAARSSVNPNLYGFCDGMLFDKVFTAGYFSTASIHMYGQEGTNYNRCKFWNSDKDAYIGIHTGFDSVPMFSDYMTPTTGSQSYINVKYTGVDYLFLPEGGNATVTGISQAATAVVTAPGHPFVNGDFVVIGLVNGMTQINNIATTVTNVTPTTFELVGVNSTGFSAYTSSGQVVIAQTKPSVLFARGEQHHFDTCYIVNYGSDSIQFDFPDGHDLKSVWFDVLFEGIGSRSHIHFADAGTIYGFKLTTYNTHCRDHVLFADAATVALFKPEIVVTNSSASAPTLVNDTTRFAMYGANVYVPSSAALSNTSLQDRFVGVLSNSIDGATNVNSKYVDYRDGAYAATVTSSVGAITSYTATGFFKRIGDLVYVDVTVNITNNGTGSGGIKVTLPYTAAERSHISGREYALSGNMLSGFIAPSDATVSVSTYNGLYPVATGSVFVISGVYRTSQP